ncbi:MAG: glutamate--tRNA ligase [Rickettsiales bacterium]|nr:glutamate--tRNA ligase [Rickettsiales bacterium]
MTVSVRFAPSPTGLLHVGNLRTALINWLFARKHGGQFILRFDDTDVERSKTEYEDGIREDLQWLGLGWDREFRQQERMEHYERAKNRLIESDHLYPCYETAEELDIKRKMLASRGKPPIYDRAALKLTKDQIEEFEAEGRTPHWRFKLNDKDIEWDDLIRGHQKLRTAHISDPVLVRADGVPLYTLSSTVDDGETGTTHILRGEDHVTNTAVQIQIFEALGYEPPIFSHNALLQMKDTKLSKRTGEGGTVVGLRNDGYEAMSVNSLLARLGTSDSVEAFLKIEDLITQFDINKFGRAAANYDEGELARLNHSILSVSHFNEVKDRVAEIGLPQIDETFWNSTRPNLQKLADIKDWWQILKEPLEPSIDAEDSDYCAQAAAAIDNVESFKEWTNMLKETSGRKGKQLFMPLRKALTGREDGPEMARVFELLPKETAIERLKGKAA